MEGFRAGPRLTLSGYRVDDPELLGACEYEILLSEDGRTFTGSSRSPQGPPGELEGSVSLLRGGT